MFTRMLLDLYHKVRAFSAISNLSYVFQEIYEYLITLLATIKIPIKGKKKNHVKIESMSKAFNTFMAEENI